MTEKSCAQPEHGGPAFPIPNFFAEQGALALESAGAPEEMVEQFTGHACGMTLRDYFAAKAMQSIRADESFALRHDPEQVADRAYEQADAMLKARGGAA